MVYMAHVITYVRIPFGDRYYNVITYNYELPRKYPRNFIIIIIIKAYFNVSFDV